MKKTLNRIWYKIFGAPKCFGYHRCGNRAIGSTNWVFCKKCSDFICNELLEGVKCAFDYEGFARSLFNVTLLEIDCCIPMCTGKARLVARADGEEGRKYVCDTCGNEVRK